jgi:hypothetical protein
MEFQTGKTYRVKLRDCCIEGEFTARLAAIVIHPDPDDPQDDGMEYCDLVFTNGVTLTQHWGCRFEEVPMPPVVKEDPSELKLRY